MKTRAAIAYAAGKPLEIVTCDLEGPKAGEVLVEIRASGVCHTDEFTRSGEIDHVIPPRPSNWANTMREARYITAVEYIQANRLRTRLIGDLERTLADAGVAAWVSAPSGPHLTLTNLTGHHSVCLPVGFEPVAGAPADSPRRTVVAATFHARLYRDELALAAAHALQRASDWHRRRPPIV